MKQVHVEGQNVAIEFRWAENQYGRLRALAADPVARDVALIVAGPLPATLAAKATPSTIPIVFANGNDPVAYGLVSSLNQPGGNVTRVSFLFNVQLTKQLELLQETVPNATMIGFLVNPNNPNAALGTQEALNAANMLGKRLLILKGSTAGEIEAAFSTLLQQRVGALLIHADTFFTDQHQLLATLTIRERIPGIYFSREFAASGGLMSYGASIKDAYRQAGIYAGRILKGAKPATTMAFGHSSLQWLEISP